MSKWKKLEIIFFLWNYDLFSSPHLHKCSCDDFWTFYVFGLIGVLRQSFEIHEYVSISISELSSSLSTLSWSNGHWQYSSNHFCPWPTAPSASRSSPSTKQCVLYPFYSCYVVYPSFCYPVGSTRGLSHLVHLVSGLSMKFPIHDLLPHTYFSCYLFKLLMVTGISKFGGFCADFYF